MDAAIIISLAILILSVIIHEVSHGYAALFLGDPTAKLEGRLTLNPLKHIDPIGSILVPIITSLAGVAFGWAKPVPYNPYNLKNQRWGEAMVAFAGPFSNIIIAVVFSVLIRFSGFPIVGFSSFEYVAGIIVIINLMLAIFNLIPFPPLDGSKILFSVFPQGLQSFRQGMERYGMLLVFILIFFLWKFLNPLISSIFYFLTGLAN